MTEQQTVRFKGMSDAAQKLTDSFCYLSYGSPSAKTWKKACDDSLERSRRRRARAAEDSGGWRFGLWLLFCLLIFLVALLIIGLAKGELQI